MTNETATRFKAWWDAIRAKLRRPGWIAAFLVWALLFVLKAFAEDTTVKVVRAVWSFLGRSLTGIISSSVGMAGLAFLALLAVLIVRAYWETRPVKETKRIDALMEREFKLEKEIAERQHAEFAGQLSERDATIKEQAEALTHCQAESRALFQQLTYRDRLFEPTPLNEANFAVMFARVEEMMPNILAAANNADKVWRHFLSQFNADKDSALAWLGETVNDEAIAPTKRAYRRLQELVATKQDPRPILAVFYSRYCDWRTWILRYSKLLHQNIYTAPGSVEWHKHDAQFFQDLKQRFSTSHFTDVRNVAVSYNENYGVQYPLPDPP